MTTPVAPTHRLIDTSVPRYTSYPTAPHFHAGVTGKTVSAWIDALPNAEPISLYLHIPFCDRLCWFCACHTKQTLRYEPVAEFLCSLQKEIKLIGARVGDCAPVSAIHLGGGSPTMLKPNDLLALKAALDDAFSLSADCTISVEIDPNDMNCEKLDALAAIGLTRASLGIQDFAPHVQQAINRQQSFETTARVVEGLRARGVASVNFDLLYGLPHQTVGSLLSTVDQSLSLRPDRVALFGYAHVPWFKKHQTMIEEAALPDTAARLAQAASAMTSMVAAGYQAIGIDHFALPDDSLARAEREGRIRRNFQGYTDETHETLIGLGPSAVSRYREGYAQTIVATGEYRRLVDEGRLPVARGIECSIDDRARGWVIERLMCDFSFSISRFRDRFGAAAEPVLRDAALAAQAVPEFVCEGDRFTISSEPRSLARIVASRFDAYLELGRAKHSQAS